MTTLGDLARAGVLEFSDGYRTKRTEHSDSGYRILRAGDVHHGRIHPAGPDFVSDRYESAIGLKAARLGDVVLTTKGTVGRTAIISHLQDDVVYSPQICFFRTRRPDVLDPRFLFRWLSSPEFVDQAAYRKDATDMAPYISLRDLATTGIELPPLLTQRAIADTLGALDDKIAANSRVCQVADALAGLLAYGALHEERELADVATIVMGTSPKGETLNGNGAGIEFFQGVRDFGIRTPASRVFTTSPLKLAEIGDSLVSVRAPVGSVNRADRSICIGRGLAAVRSAGAPHALFHALRMAKTSWESFNGEGTVFGSIGQGDLRRVRIRWAEGTALRELEQDLGSLERRIDHAEAESRHLATLRDTLLPHLMSGRITVREAVQQVEEVL